MVKLTPEIKLIIGLVVGIIVIIAILGVIAGGGIWLYYGKGWNWIKSLFSKKTKPIDVKPETYRTIY